MTIALRLDGASVIKFEYSQADAVIHRTIELPTGVTVVVDDVRQRRSSTCRSGTSFRARMDSSRGCIRNDVGDLVFRGEIVGEGDVVAGYDTVRVQSDRSTFWFARDVGCAHVKSITKLPGGGTSEKVASLITPGDPDSALFSVPDTYEEVPPSVLHRMAPDSAEARRTDTFYFQCRPPK
jgi:hypothetical protein